MFLTPQTKDGETGSAMVDTHGMFIEFFCVFLGEERIREKTLFGGRDDED